MVRSRRSVQVLVLTGIIASSAFAGPINYVINFTTTHGSPTPTGSFSYNGGTATFTNFDVVWAGITFDLTSDANSGGVSTGCAAANSTTIFQVLSGTSECPSSPSGKRILANGGR
jgi:hypothetical protein